MRAPAPGARRRRAPRPAAAAAAAGAAAARTRARRRRARRGARRSGAAAGAWRTGGPPGWSSGTAPARRTAPARARRPRHECSLLAVRLQRCTGERGPILPLAGDAPDLVPGEMLQRAVDSGGSTRSAARTALAPPLPERARLTARASGAGARWPAAAHKQAAPLRPHAFSHATRCPRAGRAPPRSRARRPRP